MEQVFEAARSRYRFVSLAFAALMALGGVVLLVVAVLFASEDPRVTYRVEGGRLTVAGGGWPSGRVTVPLERITGIREVTLRDGHRRFGTSAPHLCSGEWSYDGLGEVWQATDCSERGLLLQRDDGQVPIVVTPADPAAFTAAVAARADGTFEPAARPGPWVGLLFLPVFAGPLVLWTIAAYAVLGPRRLRYEVGGGDLVVRGALRARRYRLAGRTARRGRASAWLRLFGTSFPGFHVGLFRVAGRNVRLAATRLDDGVHLDGEPPLFVTPADVDGFLAALREGGASLDAPPPS